MDWFDRLIIKRFLCNDGCTMSEETFKKLIWCCFGSMEMLIDIINKHKSHIPKLSQNVFLKPYYPIEVVYVLY